MDSKYDLGNTIVKTAQNHSCRKFCCASNDDISGIYYVLIANILYTNNIIVMLQFQVSSYYFALSIKNFTSDNSK